MIRRIVAILAIVALAGALVLAFLDDATHKPVAPQGDMLGTESGEPFSSYVGRADRSLADADQSAYALITFAQPLTPAEAESVLTGIGRVNAMIVALASPFALPEPIAGETRADVFQRELDRIADSLAGVGDVPVPERIDAVVVRDTGDVLRAVAGAPEIAAVEVLPPDAAWGRFGVRPVDVTGG
ncbi:hypothetical protein [Corynebacterium comes]|uniref:Uncharacterized protein n=1 Tax=Corynebacterium comes TaxID=2675218 RepID=A0A6B8W0V5_9CORY|nr:hypothetical protein [Corynebacterium comes]QGU04985.1 hypothetical protein CETAM_08655 [Corynebacterium comes]